jgi:hypothetical protein
MDIEIKVEKNNLGINHLKICEIKFKKMLFLYNALDSGWSIKKNKDSYIFTKNHEGRKEIFDDKYLTKFMIENLDIENILS